MRLPRSTRIVVALWAAAGLVAALLSLAHIVSSGAPGGHASIVFAAVFGALHGGQLDLAHHALHRR